MQVDPRTFQVHPSSGIPIYRQVMEQVKSLIAAGTLQAGDMLPSVRELSGVLEVNMMTISRAWSKLQDEGVVEHVRGRGVRVVAQQPEASLKERRQDISQMAEPVVLRAVQLGLTDDQIVAIIKQLLKGQHR
jgi:GntR family transcriptional regulator